jgi:N utilization substance protein B
MTGSTPSSIEAEFRTDNDFANVDGEYFNNMLVAITQRSEELDALFEPFLDRELAVLDCIERNLLRLGTFELLDRVDVPAKVTLNETVALAKKFGATDSYRYINGVLDQVGLTLRAHELAEQ